MKKLLVPVALALVGLGAGIGAGFVLKPPPPEIVSDACSDPHGAADVGAEHAESAEGHAAEVMADPCAEVAAVDPFDPASPSAKDSHAGGEEESHVIYVPLAKPFVVPVFSGQKVVSMVVISVSVAANLENPNTVQAIEPRLRDRFLEAMFLHSNSGGFDGSFTTGRKIEDLKSALLRAAQSIMGRDAVAEVLITEINRQDV